MALSICLHSRTTFVARIIRWFTHSNYSHVSLVLSDGRHVQAREWIGVAQFDRFNQSDKEEVDWFELVIPLAEEQVQRLYAFIRQTIGQPYDYRTVLSFLWKGRPTRESQTAWFCSEWVYAALQAADCQLLRETEAWKLTPGDIALSPLIKATNTPRPVYI